MAQLILLIHDSIVPEIYRVKFVECLLDTNWLHLYNIIFNVHRMFNLLFPILKIGIFLLTKPCFVYNNMYNSTRFVKFREKSKILETIIINVGSNVIK